jgi:hypothetical protein
MRTTNTRTLNWRRPIPGEDASAARLMAICTALASEVVVLRERLDTHERLAEQSKPATRAGIEAFQPTPEDTAERDSLRKRQIETIFRALKVDAEQEAQAAAQLKIKEG